MSTGLRVPPAPSLDGVPVPLCTLVTTPACRAAPPPARADSDRQRRIDAAVAALAPNSRKAYASAWRAWQRWADEHGRPVLPAAPGDVADYLMVRHTTGAAPATVRAARAAIAKVHRVSGFTDPTADGLCGDVLKRIGREGRDRGRGQAAAIGWQQAEKAARRAEQDGSGLRGLRDCAIILLMSDSLARISEVAALQVADVEEDDADGGVLTIRVSKTDQLGTGHTRYLGPATLQAVRRYLTAAGHRSGPLFRQVRRGGHGSAAPLGAESIRAIIRARAAEITGSAGRIGGHSLRVGSARDLAAAGASVAELQQAGGWRSPSTPGVYIRREEAARGPVARRRYQVGG